MFLDPSIRKQIAGESGEARVWLGPGGPHASPYPSPPVEPAGEPVYGEGGKRRYSLILDKVSEGERDRFRALSSPESYFEIKKGREGERVSYSVEMADEEYTRALRDVADPDVNLLYIEPVVKVSPASNGASPGEVAADYLKLPLSGQPDWQGQGVNVAVLDNFVSEAFLDTVFAGRINSVTSVTGVSPYLGTHPHGVQMSGLAVPPEARLTFICIADPDGNYPTDAIAAGLNEVAGDPGVDIAYVTVVSGSAVVDDAARNAVSAGKLIFNPLGNESQSVSGFPAGVLGISSYDARTNSLSPYSNYGPDVWAACAGDPIYAYNPDASVSVIAEGGGTSSAAALACDIAARLMSGSHLSASEAKTRMEATAEPTGAGAEYEGVGVLKFAAPALPEPKTYDPELRKRLGGFEELTPASVSFGVPPETAGPEPISAEDAEFRELAYNAESDPGQYLEQFQSELELRLGATLESIYRDIYDAALNSGESALLEIEEAGLVLNINVERYQSGTVTTCPEETDLIAGPLNRTYKDSIATGSQLNAAAKRVAGVGETVEWRDSTENQIGTCTMLSDPPEVTVEMSPPKARLITQDEIDNARAFGAYDMGLPFSFEYPDSTDNYFMLTGNVYGTACDVQIDVESSTDPALVGTRFVRMFNSVLIRVLRRNQENRQSPILHEGDLIDDEVFKPTLEYDGYSSSYFIANHHDYPDPAARTTFSEYTTYNYPCECSGLNPYLGFTLQHTVAVFGVPVFEDADGVEYTSASTPGDFSEFLQEDGADKVVGEASVFTDYLPIETPVYDTRLASLDVDAGTNDGTPPAVEPRPEPGGGDPSDPDYEGPSYGGPGQAPLGGGPFAQIGGPPGANFTVPLTPGMLPLPGDPLAFVPPGAPVGFEPIRMPITDFSMPEMPPFGCHLPDLGNFDSCPPMPGTGGPLPGGLGPDGKPLPGHGSIGTGPPGGWPGGDGGGGWPGGGGGAYRRETFDERRCFTDERADVAIRELGNELGLDENTLLFEEPCSKRFTKCFPAGSSKFDAIWWISDTVCGHEPIDDGDGPVKIGPVKPLPTTWTFHEDVDLFTLERNYSGLDVYHAVEVFWPGTRKVPVLAFVNGPYPTSPDNVHRIEVGPEVTREMAEGIAAREAAKSRRSALSVKCAVPYDRRRKLRHQLVIQRPSRGFEERLMITAHEGDWSSEGNLHILTASLI